MYVTNVLPMKFKIKEFFDYYKVDAVFYSIEVYLPKITENEFLTLFEKFKYYCQKNHISCLVVFSDTDSTTAKQMSVNTGKVGRPKKIVVGTKVNGHIHSIVVGKKAYTTAQQIKKAVNKKYKRNVSKVKSLGDGLHGYNFIVYCMRQENKYRTYGDFDFNTYVSEHKAFDDW